MFIAAAVALCVIFALGAYKFLNGRSGSNDERSIQERYSNYTAAMVALEFGKGYDFLTDASKSKFSRDEWIRNWEKTVNPRQKEEFRRVELSTDRNTAKLYSALTVKNEERLNVQTWLKSPSGTWQRAYAEDNPNAFSKSTVATLHLQSATAKQQARPSSGSAAKNVVAALDEVVQMYNAAAKVGRMFGNDEATMSTRDLSAAIDKVKFAMTQYRTQSEAESNPELHEAITEAADTFAYAQINMDSQLRSRLADEISNQMRNGVTMARKAKELLVE